MSLVDQYGRPFKPDSTISTLKMAMEAMNSLATKLSTNDAERLNKFNEMNRIAGLRKSCGIEPEKIVFKRPIPFA